MKNIKTLLSLRTKIVKAGWLKNRIAKNEELAYEKKT